MQLAVGTLDYNSSVQGEDRMRWETDWLGSHARLTPNRTVLMDDETNQQYTFFELNEKASRIATYLVKLGIQKGDRIAFLAPNNLFYFELLFACAKMGAIFVPLNFRLNAKELTYILKDAAVSACFYDSSLKKLADEIHSSIPALKFINIQTDYETMHLHDAWIEESAVSYHDPWVIIYTGGTTGLPKGVVLSHKNILANAINTIISWKISANDITYTVLPLFHTGGLNALTIPVLYSGGKVIIGRQFNPEKTLKVIVEQKITIILLVPTMHHMIQRTELFQTIEIPHNPIFLSGGAPCPLPIYEGYLKRGFQFKEGYGLTEAGPNNFYLSPEEAKVKRGSVGKPMIHNRITLRNDQDEEVPVGEVGEIVIEGDHVFAYYWNKPEITQQTVRNGRLYSGDLGRCDQDGYYYIVGRKKEMIISGGENIYPLEIETVLQDHPDLLEAVVIGVEDEKWGEKVIAYVVKKSDVALSAEDLIHYCHQHLARYKTPKEFYFLDELPKTSVGKIDKKKLMEMYSKV